MSDLLQKTVRYHLDDIERHVAAIRDMCSDYGGWAGEDDEAKRAVSAGLDLASCAQVVALHGREFAES